MSDLKQLKQTEQQAVQEYQEMIKQVKPKPPVLKNSFWAFLMGGAICTLGQGLFNLFIAQGLAKLDAVAAASTVLIFTAALLTGLGIYDDFAKFAGAGSIVPITGFANAMVAPALEFKREGMVLGVAARLFSIAGPVLVFGFVTSWLIGLVTFIFT